MRKSGENRLKTPLHDMMSETCRRAAKGDEEVMNVEGDALFPRFTLPIITTTNKQQTPSNYVEDIGHISKDR